VRKIKEVLRLQALGLSQRQIALSCSVGQATVSEYLKAAETAGLKWSDVADWDDDRLWQAMAPPGKHPHRGNARRSRTTRPSATNCKPISTSPCSCSGRSTATSTRRDIGIAGSASYTAVGCGGRSSCCGRNTAPARSYSWTTPAPPSPFYNAENGEVWEAAIFVAVLGASNYTYAEASLTQGLADWIGAHMRASSSWAACPKS